MSEYTPERFTPPSGMTVSAADGAGEWEGPSAAEYLRAIRKRFWLVLLVGALGIGLAGYAVSRSETMLASRAVLQLADQRGGPSGGLAGLAVSLGGGGGSQEAQAQIIRSRLLLGQVVDSLGLRLQRPVSGVLREQVRPTSLVEGAEVSPEATVGSLHLEFGPSRVRVRGESSTIEAAYGERVQIEGVSFTVPRRPDRDEVTLLVLSRDVAINTLIESVTVYPREGSNLLDVVVTGYDPIITQRITNATADIYRRYSSRKEMEEAERRRAFVLEQLRTTEKLLLETQAELTEFRKREKLYSSRALAMAEQTGRAELEVRRAELESDRRVYQLLLSQLQQPGRSTEEVLRSIASSASVANNVVINGLYGQLSGYQSQRDSLMIGPQRSARTNPDLQRLDSLLALTETRLVSATRNHMNALDAQIAALDLIRDRQQSALTTLSDAEPEEARLLLRMESIADAAQELRTRFYTAGMAEAGITEQVTVLDRALPGEVAGTPPFRTMMLGLIFGLMVGAAGAIGLDSINRSIRRRDELERVLHVPGLGVIPRIATHGGRWPRLGRSTPVLSANGTARSNGAMELVTASQVHSLGAEAYRTLRTNLVFSPSIEALRSMVVTSAGGGEGKTTTAANLAVTFAQQGRRVLLVDCDLRRPRLHSIFHVPRTPGLAEVLLGEVDLEQALHATSVAKLSVLPAGAFPRVSATDLFGGGVIRSLVSSVAEDFDLVILDTAPLLVTANAAILGTQVDGVLLVVRAGSTARDAARQALHQLYSVGARVVGAVLNDPDAEVARYAGYGGDEAAHELAAKG